MKLVFYPSDYGRVDLIVFPLWKKNWEWMKERFGIKPYELPTWDLNKQIKTHNGKLKKNVLYENRLVHNGYEKEKFVKLSYPLLSEWGRIDYYKKGVVIEQKFDIRKNFIKNIAQLSLYTFVTSSSYGILEDVNYSFTIDKYTATVLTSYFLARLEKIVELMNVITFEEYVWTYKKLLSIYPYARYQSLFDGLQGKKSFLSIELLSLSVDPLLQYKKWIKVGEWRRGRREG